jgi:hypothetical protein
MILNTAIELKCNLSQFGEENEIVFTDSFNLIADEPAYWAGGF